MLLSFVLSWSFVGILVAYSAAVILASILGGLLPEWIRLTHNRMQLMISFVGGLMLGIAVFHMVPHSITALGIGEINQVMMGVMCGLIATFFLLRFSHFHQHGPADFGIHADELAKKREEETHICSTHNHPIGLEPGSAVDADGQAGCEHGEHASPTRWLAVLIGLGLHTLMDGVAMAAGVVAESGHGHGGVLPGLGIFLAVLLHKPLDAVSITSLMHPVTTANKRLLVNIGFALMCPAGALLFLLGASVTTGLAASFAGWGLAFSAGVFLCIALSDLLPEMEFHSHSRIPLSIALLLGISAAWAIGLAEGEHAHDPRESASEVHSHDGHSGHDDAHDHAH